MVGLGALPTYKSGGHFQGLVDDKEQNFQRLRKPSQCLDTGNGSVYERKEEPNGVRLVFYFDICRYTGGNEVQTLQYSGTIFSLLVAKPEGNRKRKERGGKGAD